MQTDEAKNLYARRKELSEPTFGILKDQMGARRFLLRGLPNVRAEFALLATAFNLRTLWRILMRPLKRAAGNHASTQTTFTNSHVSWVQFCYAGAIAATVR